MSELNEKAIWEADHHVASYCGVLCKRTLDENPRHIVDVFILQQDNGTELRVHVQGENEFDQATLKTFLGQKTHIRGKWFNRIFRIMSKTDIRVEPVDGDSTSDDEPLETKERET